MELILKHKVYILAMGDPGQLPPLDPDMDNHVLDTPHVFLDEIMRQAQDSEIIRLSMWVREGNPVATFPVANEQVKIVSQAEMVSGMYDWADQVLCATNSKRQAINDIVRKQRGFDEGPCVGDKIISLHNHWQYFSSGGTWALTNGAIGTIANFQIQQVYLPYYISKPPINYMYTDIQLEDGEMFNGTPIDHLALTTGTPALDPKQTYLLNRNKNCPDAPFDFAYAYAITCHKAQGSEWDKVLVIEENFPREASEHIRWLYTAVTRAKEKLVVVKK